MTTTPNPEDTTTQENTLHPAQGEDTESSATAPPLSQDNAEPTREIIVESSSSPALNHNTNGTSTPSPLPSEQKNVLPAEAESSPTAEAVSQLERANSREDDELARIAAEDDGTIALLHELEFVAPPAKGSGNENKTEGPDLRIQTVREARNILEALLFATTEPLSIPRISRLMNNLHPRCVRALLLELQLEYEQRGGALQIVEVAGGFQFATRPQFADWIFRMQRNRRRNSLSPATLETLAIIAYKQPVTRAEIEAIRGVDSSAPIHTLLELGLIEVSGRREVIGRPQLYATTNLFLKTFGLRSLGDLPSIQELKRMYEQEDSPKRRIEPEQSTRKVGPSDNTSSPEGNLTPTSSHSASQTPSGDELSNDLEHSKPAERVETSPENSDVSDRKRAADNGASEA
ncbi:MAG: SMC-Scp complex subunit ScpB [Candidatus Hydrogenedentota bacterium]|uniref:Segregation and condensation protein B n=1 Tax=Sumerlaea chitinivorans TaxID=2250252 RepID=A0A2Z4Y2I7_SUMC1|nr:Segregation and condensation protein B [Candidatus Sumerlaea chitinivorans]RMH24099.1 MAG: SMC-Scp complex subunit ScpB [Candidatus Hydrogenedentota bacterium]